MDVSRQGTRNFTILLDFPLNSRTVWTLDTIALAIMLIVLSVIGIMGNTPTLIVFLKWKDRHSSNTFIKVLAVIDLLVCAFVMPFTIYYELHLVTSDVPCRFFEYLSHFTVFASNSTLVAIAIERYIAVCKIGLKLTTKIIYKGTMAIFVVSAFVAVPSTGVFAAVDKDVISNLSCSFPHENAPQEVCHFTYSIIGVEAVTIYQIFQAVMFVIILIVIIVLYSSVYIVLWKRTKFRKQIRERRTEFQSIIDQIDEADCQYSELRPVQNESENMIDQVIDFRNIKYFHTKRNSLPSLYLGMFQNTSQRWAKSEPDDLLNAFKISNKNWQRRTSEPSNPISPEETDRQIKTLALTVSPSRNKTRRPKCENLLQRVDTAKRRKYCYHIRTAKMLFMCTVIYFVTWIPFWLDIFAITNSRTFRYLFFIAHATNPIIFGIVNKQVRAASKALL